MKEIYVQAPAKLNYTLFVEGVETDAVSNPMVSVNGISIGQSTKSSTGKYSIDLPASYNAAEGFIDVVWTFNIGSSTYNVKDAYVIVTPYIEWSEFKDLFAQYNQTYNDYRKAERVARYVINSYCSQKFGKIQTTYYVDGSGDDGLILPERLAILNDVSWDDGDNVIYTETDFEWQVVADGWILRRENEYRPARIGCDPYPRFKRNRSYIVFGTWGYLSVPAEVRQAAELLLNSYVCPDSSYRNHYIDNIKSGEWRIQYAGQAWAGTGDANVDMMLKEFRQTPMIGVI